MNELPRFVPEPETSEVLVRDRRTGCVVAKFYYACRRGEPESVAVGRAQRHCDRLNAAELQPDGARGVSS